MKKILLILIMCIHFNINAQTIPLTGNFIVGTTTFSCTSRSPMHNPTPPRTDKIVTIQDANAPVFADATLYSSTCTASERYKEARRYQFARSRNNSIQMFNIIKTVFSPQRCQQLAGGNLDVYVGIYPSNNSIYTVVFCTSSDVAVTQQEIAQLDNLIKTTTNFTFPKIKGTCLNVSNIGLGPIGIEFSKLYIDPYYSGIDTMWDEDD